MRNMLAGGRRRTDPMVVLAVIIAFCWMLVAVPSALGQAAVDQYVPSANPSGHHGGPGGGPGGAASLGAGGTPGASSKQGHASEGSAVDSRGAGIVGVSPGGGPGSASGANAPGTDYPLTPFVLIIAGVVLLVLAIRFLPGFVRRLRLRGAS